VSLILKDRAEDVADFGLIVHKEYIQAGGHKSGDSTLRACGPPSTD
jgi:hypothetical protein